MEVELQKAINEASGKIAQKASIIHGAANLSVTYFCMSVLFFCTCVFLQG